MSIYHLFFNITYLMVSFYTLLLNRSCIEQLTLRVPGDQTIGFNILTGTRKSHCPSQGSVNKSFTEPGLVQFISKTQIALERLTY